MLDLKILISITRWAQKKNNRAPLKSLLLRRNFTPRQIRTVFLLVWPMICGLCPIKDNRSMVFTAPCSTDAWKSSQLLSNMTNGFHWAYNIKFMAAMHKLKLAMDLMFLDCWRLRLMMGRRMSLWFIHLSQRLRSGGQGNWEDWLTTPAFLLNSSSPMKMETSTIMALPHSWFNFVL